ncbi:cysteine hydrolase [Pseudomonas sp. P66]|jgi:nicotinamidase-related amidase|uniref:Cysteine hydrolase n=1 Tax=Pseudomonas arcuscaelestis TaxID=2710591 RepID=A0ABS2C1F5_9PSED|nr:isochorismatase family protein [Pseudomonas arcuscaelestis]MBM3103574.1 cysteine hydrolase [Pseudomonas arcuscaelestis]MBM3110465.1 cysteine hydrolase [Pseudomonas arcuscaelestis]MBM5459697.1 cysteine hydrolase [Pseudomonas arcuscaelestis]
MRQVLLIVDVQSTFSPPEWLVDGVRALSERILTIASVELHDELITPFQQQLGWHPAAEDESLVEADRVFVKHGYGQTAETIEYIKQLGVERVLVCGIQTETCVLAAGFALFDAGLTPTLVTDLTVGSSLDRSGQLGIKLWEHHFRQVTTRAEILAELDA